MQEEARFEHRERRSGEDHEEDRSQDHRLRLSTGCLVEVRRLLGCFFRQHCIDSMSSVSSTMSEAAGSQSRLATAKRKRVRFGSSTVHTVERINHHRDELFYNGSDYRR